AQTAVALVLRSLPGREPRRSRTTPAALPARAAASLRPQRDLARLRNCVSGWKVSQVGARHASRLALTPEVHEQSETLHHELLTEHRARERSLQAVELLQSIGEQLLLLQFHGTRKPAVLLGERRRCRWGPTRPARGVRSVGRGFRWRALQSRRCGYLPRWDRRRVVEAG